MFKYKNLIGFKVRILIVLIVLSLTILNVHAVSETDFEEQWTASERVFLSSKKESLEFKYSNEELLEMSKWTNKSFDDMWNDALNCDRGALYMMGVSLLTGSGGFTIDVQLADMCFSMSASLGFAPALEQIIRKNIEEKNFFLVMVYSNLISSLGHSEYITPYHELRTDAINKFGNEISKEIERIASLKNKLICNNIENLKKSIDRKKNFIEMSYNGNLIDFQDLELNLEYWIRFTKFQNEAENEARRFKNILSTDYQEFFKVYEISRENLRKALDKLKDGKTINKMQLDALKDAKKAIGKADDFIILVTIHVLNLRYC